MCACPIISPPSCTGRAPSTETCSTRPPTRSRASSTSTSAPPEHEIARGGEPGQPCADDHDVRHAGTVSSSARMRNASAGRYAVTAAPTSYSSTSPEFATSACTRSPAGERDEHLGRRAEVDEALDRRRDPVLADRRGRLDADALGSDRQPHDAGARLPLLGAERDPADVDGATVEHAAAHEVRDAEEVGDERRLRVLVDVARRTQLLDLPVGHHREAVRHRQRLLLVVRHVEERDADLPLDRLQLDLELTPQLGVEGAEWLVEEQDGRGEHERTGERDALLLAARELVRPPLSEAAEPDELERLRHAAALLVLRHVLEAEPESDVLLHREVREEGVALEHGVDRALVRRRLRDVVLADDDPPRVGPLEAGDHPQRRRLAAAGRAEQREELAAADLERHVVDGRDVVERLAHALEDDGLRAERHASSSRWRHDARSTRAPSRSSRPR